MGNLINVGIADLNIASGDDTLVTYALGSCVGICLYDSVHKIAGLSHIILPWSKESTTASNNKYRFADTGITELIIKMNQSGASASQLTAKIAGGAQMFAANSAVFNIGERNVEAVKKVLVTYKIPIIASDTGENYGRTVFFSPQTGIVTVKSVGRGQKDL